MPCFARGGCDPQLVRTYGAHVGAMAAHAQVSGGLGPAHCRVVGHSTMFPRSMMMCAYYATGLGGRGKGAGGIPQSPRR